MLVEQAGVDTWSPAWYVAQETAAARAMRCLANVPAAGGSWLIGEPIDGHRVGWFPRAGLLFAEGHPGGDRLAAGDELPARLGQLGEALRDYGLDVPPGETRAHWRPAGARSTGFAGIRRLDSTADLRFDSTAEGLAVLAGVGALSLPASKSHTWRGPGGRIETVSFHGHAGGRMIARWYDKGLESGLAPRGQLIRPEDQRRFNGQTRRHVNEVAGDYVRESFRRRFVPLWRASEGVTVGGPLILAGKMADLLESGEVTVGEAERLAGFLVLDAAGVRAPSRRTYFRRRSRLRDLGLVLADGAMQEVEVDLADVLEGCLEADAWDSRG